MENLSFSEKEQETLLKLVKLYSETKVIIVYSEEVDADSKYNIQIWKELRDAFDHLVRAFINKNENTETYFLINLEKSYAHVYRACYDAAEGAVFSLKKNILDIIFPYSQSQLVKIVPNYSDDRILIEKINSKLAIYRNNKDIGKADNIDFSDLLGIIDQLKTLNEKYINLLPLLKDVCVENKKSARGTVIKNILYMFAGALVSALLSWLL
jgi:hypothetical protein